MIRVFTLGPPNSGIKDFAQAIFSLEKYAYNLPTKNHKHQELFNQLYKLGVAQIIHDGKPDEIRCMDGYLYAYNQTLAKETNPQNVMVIKNPQIEKK